MFEEKNYNEAMLEIETMASRAAGIDLQHDAPARALASGVPSERVASAGVICTANGRRGSRGKHTLALCEKQLSRAQTWAAASARGEPEGSQA